jgi:DHA2 family multidrug resistance protein
VQLRLFQNRNFAVACTLMLVVFAVLLGSTVLLPLFAQTQMGYSAKQAGEVLSPGGFAIMLLMPLVGWLVSRVDARYLMAAGLLIIAFSMFNLTRITADIDLPTAMRWRVYQAAGMAFLFVPINTIAYTDMPRNASNQVSALTNLMRNMGGSVGISAVTTLIERRQQVHQAYLAHNTVHGNPQFDQMVAHMTAQLSTRMDPVQASQRAYGNIYGMVQHQAAVLAYVDTFWIMGMLMLLPIVLLFFAKRNKPGQAAAAH